MKTFYDYLRSDYDRNVIDHSLRVQEIAADGSLRVYIHPANVNGTTPFFDVQPTGEVVVPIPPDSVGGQLDEHLDEEEDLDGIDIGYL